MDEETRYEAIQDAQAKAYAEMLEEANREEKNECVCLSMAFTDIEMKMKAMAKTLQGQIEEIRQRIEALENESDFMDKQ